MATQKLVKVGGIVVLVLVVLGLGMTYPRGNSVVQQLVTGSVTGPDSSFQTETHNGVPSSFSRQGLVTATTTVCAIKSPSATSSIDFIGVNWNVSSTSASTFTIATSTTAYATTTALVTGSIAANGQYWATFNGTTMSHVMAPNTFIVVSMAGGVGNAVTFSPVGMCEAKWNNL